ncbi:FecR family protein, partial [Parabacteroides sp. OttesenSCG-928-O15]|nr:FecR family protein [Parabacteroides sp. OttesenSCG-928-O15]
MEDKIHAYFQQALNKEDSYKLLQAVEADPSLKDQFREIKNVYALAVLTSLPNDSEEGKASYKRFTRKYRRKTTIRLVGRVAAYAAVLLLLIGFTHWWTLRQVEREDAELLSLHVPAGQRLRLTLQDGSSVWLNAQTTITYPSRFTDEERKVFIDGEALFDITPDKKRPFLVSSRGVEMKVLGTRFNL